MGNFQYELEGTLKFVSLVLYVPLSLSLVVLSSIVRVHEPCTVQLASVLTTPAQPLACRQHVARGDILNERTCFNSLPGKAE